MGLLEKPTYSTNSGSRFPAEHVDRLLSYGLGGHAVLGAGSQYIVSGQFRSTHTPYKTLQDRCRRPSTGTQNTPMPREHRDPRAVHNSPSLQTWAISHLLETHCLTGHSIAEVPAIFHINHGTKSHSPGSSLVKTLRMPLCFRLCFRLWFRLWLVAFDIAHSVPNWVKAPLPGAARGTRTATNSSKFSSKVEFM